MREEDRDRLLIVIAKGMFADFDEREVCHELACEAMDELDAALAAVEKAKLRTVEKPAA